MGYGGNDPPTCLLWFPGNFHPPAAREGLEAETRWTEEIVTLGKGGSDSAARCRILDALEESKCISNIQPLTSHQDQTRKASVLLGMSQVHPWLGAWSGDLTAGRLPCPTPRAQLTLLVNLCLVSAASPQPACLSPDPSQSYEAGSRPQAPRSNARRARIPGPCLMDQN